MNKKLVTLGIAGLALYVFISAFRSLEVIGDPFDWSSEDDEENPL